MDDQFRQMVIDRLQRGEELPREWARELFPPEKHEYELVYHGKEREKDILAETMAVPFQPVRTFGKNGDDCHNKLIFGDNLQMLKRLLEMKNAGELCNADGTPGVRLIYIDPPFATRQEFRGSQDQKAYQDKKDTEELREPSEENCKKNEYAMAHSKRVNEHLKQADSSIRYKFNFLTPSNFGAYFQFLRDGQITNFKSELDVELSSNNLSR